MRARRLLANRELLLILPRVYTKHMCVIFLVSFQLFHFKLTEENMATLNGISDREFKKAVNIPETFIDDYAPIITENLSTNDALDVIFGRRK